MTFAPWIPEKICQLQSRSLRHVTFVLSWRAKNQIGCEPHVGAVPPPARFPCGARARRLQVPPDHFPMGSTATQGSGRKTGV